MKIVSSAVAAGLMALAFGMVACSESVPPRALTRTRLGTTQRRLRAYVADHGRLPATLSELPKLTDNRDAELNDAWEHPIQYTVTGRTVTLLSLGRDGKVGGTGDDEDLQGTFTVAASAVPATRP